MAFTVYMYSLLFLQLLESLGPGWGKNIDKLNFLDTKITHQDFHEIEVLFEVFYLMFETHFYCKYDVAMVGKDKLDTECKNGIKPYGGGVLAF